MWSPEIRGRGRCLNSDPTQICPVEQGEAPAWPHWGAELGLSQHPELVLLQVPRWNHPCLGITWLGFIWVHGYSWKNVHAFKLRMNSGPGSAFSSLSHSELLRNFHLSSEPTTLPSCSCSSKIDSFLTNNLSLSLKICLLLPLANARALGPINQLPTERFIALFF